MIRSWIFLVIKVTSRKNKIREKHNLRGLTEETNSKLYYNHRIGSFETHWKDFSQIKNP